jgi:preprotein translocase subunit SecD
MRCRCTWGLDLRGGVHFLLQVDMKAALTKKAESYAGDMRTLLRDKNIRHGGISPTADRRSCASATKPRRQGRAT